MIVNVDAGKLRAFLAACEDAEEVGASEWTVDLYDVQTPVSMNILFDKKGVDVLATLEMLYDEEMDGWYLGDKIKDVARIEAVLAEVLAGIA